MSRIYELTDKSYNKFLVRGIKNESEAKALAKRVFGKYYWKQGISFYDLTENKRTPSMTKKRFLKWKGHYGG